MAEMKASLILELVDRLTGKTGPARRELDRLNASQGRFAATSAGLRATAVRSGNTTLVATRAIGAQARATDRLAASTGRYNAHIVSLHRRAEGGGPSAMALGRTHAMTRAFDHLNRKAEEYIAISRRRPRAERDAMAAAATARGAQVSYFGLMRRDERLRGGAFNGVAGGVAAARWSRRGRATAAAGPQPSGSVAEAAAMPGGLARGAGAVLAGRAGMMAAGGFAGAAAGAVALVAASTPDALSLERAMSDVRRATGATNAELDDYQKRVLTIARATGRTKEEVAGLMAAGASERRRGNDLVSYASLAAHASQVWGERASRTGETLSTLGNIYRASQPRLEGIADAIQTAATATRTKATDLAGFLREVGQEGQSAGLSAENMTAYGAALRAAGAEASASHKAMSSIVSTLSDASTQGGDFDKALRSMGLRTRTFAQAFRRDANGTFLDFLNRLNRLAPDKRDSAISNIFGSDQADEIKRLAEQVDRIRTLQGQLNDGSRTRGAVRRGFEIFSEADFAKMERAQQSIDTLMARIGYWGRRAAGAASDAVIKAVDLGHRAIDAAQPDAISRERDAGARLAELERQLAEARAPGGLTGRAAGLQASVDAARKAYEEAARAVGRHPGFRSERSATAAGLQASVDAARKAYEEAARAVGRHPGFRSERSATAAGREPSVIEQRAVEPGLHRAPAPGARPDDARRQDAAAMRAELERTLEAARAIEDRLPALRQATIGAAFNDPSRAALSSALSELDKLQAKAAEIDGQMKTLFGPEFSSRAGAAAQQAAGQINTALDGAATTAHAAGQRISAQLAAGITAGGAQVSAAMQGVAARAMANVPQSPAREGPFRFLRRGGQEIAAQLASGIGDNSGAVSDRMRTMAAAGMSASRPGGWALPRPSTPDAGSAGGVSGGGSSGGIAVSIDMGGVTIAPNGQSLDDMSRTLGERVAARIGSSLHESRA